MFWRLISPYVPGAIVTLIITIIGGVVIWFITREAPAKELLTYEITSVANLNAEQTKLSISSIAIRNNGTKPARNVTLVVDAALGHPFLDKGISFASGPAPHYEAELDKGRFQLSVPSLLPKDSISILLVSEGAGAFIRRPSVRSDETIGTQLSITAPNQKPITIILIGLLGVALGLQAAFFAKRGIRLATGRATDSMNNAAFVLLHNGDVDAASKLLEKSADLGQICPLTLSNLGLTKGLLGDPTAAQIYLDGAMFWAATKHERAVVTFNKGMLLLNQGKFSEAVAEISNAKKLSGEIVRYCRMSKFFASAAAQNPQVAALI